ncbi:MAG: hypothetical protein V3S64_03445, partial [bacterium]
MLFEVRLLLQVAVIRVHQRFQRGSQFLAPWREAAQRGGGTITAEGGGSLAGFLGHQFEAVHHQFFYFFLAETQ